MRAPNFYVSVEVERLSENRRELGSNNTCNHRAAVSCPMWRNKSLMTAGDSMQPAFVPVTDGALAHCAEPVFLGLWNGSAYFAADLSHLSRHRSPSSEPIATCGKSGRCCREKKQGCWPTPAP